MDSRLQKHPAWSTWKEIVKVTEKWIVYIDDVRKDKRYIENIISEVTRADRKSYNLDNILEPINTGVYTLYKHK